jgi:hypothetical protein
MSTRKGIIVGLSVLGFVVLAFLLYYVKSMAQVFAVNNASMTCYDQAKAHPSDRKTMDRCLKAKGVLVEDSPPPGYRRPATPQPAPADPYAACSKTPKVKKYKPKTDGWATAMSGCMNDYGVTAVVTMRRNPSTGDIDYDVSH